MSTRLVADFAAEHGLVIADILAGSGISAEELDDPAVEVAVWQELLVVRNVAAQLCEVPGAGVRLGLRYPATAYGIAAVAMLACPTVRAVYELAIAHGSLTYQFSQATGHRRDGMTAYAYDGSALPADVRRFLVERDVAVTVRGGRDVLGRTLRPRAVEFAFPAPAQRKVYDRAFGVPVVFGTAATRLVFDDAELEQPLPQANPLALRLALRQCEDMVARRRAHGTVAAQVRDRLRAASGPLPSIEEVAAAMTVTSRTLRRRLSEEGASYRDLAERTRRERADELLRAGELSVAQVAARVGYSDPSTFTHAYKRWTGRPPREQRRGG